MYSYNYQFKLEFSSFSYVRGRAKVWNVRMKASLSCALSSHHIPREAFFKVKSIKKGRKNKKQWVCVRSGDEIELNHCDLKQAEQRRPFSNLLSSIRLLAGCETENWKLKATWSHVRKKYKSSFKEKRNDVEWGYSSLSNGLWIGGSRRGSRFATCKGV